LTVTLQNIKYCEAALPLLWLWPLSQPWFKTLFRIS
jgi:hypothetical protein